MIGYVDYTNTTHEERVTTVEENELPFYSSQIADAIVRERANELVQKAVSDYLHPSMYPFIQDEARDKWLAEKLRKIRERYLKPL